MKDSILNSQYEKLAFFGSSNVPQMRTSSSSNPGTPGYWGTRQSSKPEQFNPRTAGMVSGTGAAMGGALGAMRRGGLRGGLKGGAIGLGIGALGYLGRNYMHNRLDKSKTYGNYRGNTQMHSKPSYSNNSSRYRNSTNYGNYDVDFASIDPAVGAAMGAGVAGLAHGAARYSNYGFGSKALNRINWREMFGRRGGIAALGAAAGVGYGLYRNYQKGKMPSGFMPRQQARAGTR